MLIYALAGTVAFITITEASVALFGSANNVCCSVKDQSTVLFSKNNIATYYKGSLFWLGYFDISDVPTYRILKISPLNLPDRTCRENNNHLILFKFVNNIEFQTCWLEVWPICLPRQIYGESIIRCFLMDYVCDI